MKPSDTPSQRRRFYAYMAVFILLIALSLHSTEADTASAQSETQQVQITGRVVNGTSGGQIPDDMIVFLLLIDQTQEAIIERVETSLDEDGSFLFHATPATDDQFYRLVADDGIFTPYLDLLPGETDQDNILTIFDSTTSLDDISFASYAMVVPVIDETDSQVTVLSSVRLINSGERVYLADLDDPNLTGFNLLRFNLPQEYQQLSVESDLPSGNVMEISTGFALSNPVPPGEYNILMSYTVPYQDGNLEYPLRLPFGADSVSILLPQGETQLQGMNLSHSGVEDIEGRQYISYQGENYQRGSQLDVSITGLPAAPLSNRVVDFFSSTQFNIALVSSTALVLALIIALVSIRVTRRRRVATAAATAEIISDNDHTRSQIILEIALLDELHEDGRIDQAQYIDKRRRLMRTAIEHERDPETPS